MKPRMTRIPICVIRVALCSAVEHTFIVGSGFMDVISGARSLLNGKCPINSTHEGRMNNQMKKYSFAAIFFALALFVAAPLANATTITEVQAMITSLKAKTESVVLSGKSADKDRAGLLDKLNEASLKVDQAKFCDAVAKLNDFKARVNAMINAGKINQDPALGTTGTELLADADAIIAGLNDLQTQSTGAPCSF